MGLSAMIVHDLYCPIMDDVCRHCSNEGTRQRTKACRMDGKGEVVIIQEITFGLYCNNYDSWIRNMKTCENAEKKHTNIIDYKEQSFNSISGNCIQSTLPV